MAWLETNDYGATPHAVVVQEMQQRHGWSEAETATILHRLDRQGLVKVDDVDQGSYIPVAVCTEDESLKAHWFKAHRRAIRNRPRQRPRSRRALGPAERPTPSPRRGA